MGGLKNFLGNEDGNYAVIFAIAALPIMGSVAIAVDYSNVSRLKFELSNAVDSTCVVAAREFMAGKSNAQVETAARNFFNANIDPQFASTATASFTMPSAAGNTERTMNCAGQLTYSPMFEPALAFLGGRPKSEPLVVKNEAKMRMQNLAEIALVLDNSGSMAWDKNGNPTTDVSKQRMTLMKAATKKLISNVIKRGSGITTNNPAVQFSIVPFSATVNVGANNANASWMDTRGISPIHHEHLNWGTPGTSNPTGWRTTAPDGAKLDSAGNPLTRFSIFNALKFQTGGNAVKNQCEHWAPGALTGTGGTTYSNCQVFKRTGTTTVAAVSNEAAAATGYSFDTLKARYSWTGCVEARPNGMDVTDADATGTSAFVPLFYPDEYNVTKTDGTFAVGGRNSWWPDFETASTGGVFAYNTAGQKEPADANVTNRELASWQSGTSRPREVDVRKYFVNKPYTRSASMSTDSASNTSTNKVYNRNYSQYRLFAQGAGPSWNQTYLADGPNSGCATTPITELTASETTLHAAVDAMKSTISTNIPEGIAWGWRTLSNKAPFTGGVPDGTLGVDKVVIVLTDGANTYPYYSAADGDMAGNWTYNFGFGMTGYAGNAGPGGTASRSSSSNIPRLYQGTSASPTTRSSANFQLAMDDKMKTVCANIKNKNYVVMMIALDMDPLDYTVAQRPAIEAAIANMKICSGESKRRKDADGKYKKLFWNATSDNLDETFREVADELSNLHFTQ